MPLKSKRYSKFKRKIIHIFEMLLMFKHLILFVENYVDEIIKMQNPEKCL